MISCLIRWHQDQRRFHYEKCVFLHSKGETSSGKSTIMNLLIGKDILQLPTKITASTTKICRIRNATELKIQTLDINEKKIKNMAV